MFCTWYIQLLAGSCSVINVYMKGLNAGKKCNISQKTRNKQTELTKIYIISISVHLYRELQFHLSKKPMWPVSPTQCVHRRLASSAFYLLRACALLGPSCQREL